MTPARLSVGHLARLVETRDEGRFVREFPDPALVLASPAVELERAIDTPEAGLPTERFFGGRATFGTGAYQRPGDSPAGLQLLARSEVVLLAKSGRNPLAGMVALGRAPSNDVVLPLMTVSKLHAIFSRGPGGWTITDQRSTNGTAVDDTALRPGGSVALEDGSVIRIGPDVTAKFFTPEGLFTFLALMRSGVRR